MSALAELEIALRRDRALSRLAVSHVHRATREDSMGLLRGRDAILELWVGEEPHDVTITDDFGDMIAFEVAEGDAPWRGQRWVRREEGRILAETVIETRAQLYDPPLLHPPLGELRSGRGQYDAGPAAVLPLDFPSGARAAADRLHRAWNGRAFDLGVEGWVIPLLRALPDATFTFERGLVSDDAVGLLWRMHGHNASGRRVRLIGGTVIRAGAAPISTLDLAAMEAQIAARPIDYGSSDFDPDAVFSA